MFHLVKTLIFFCCCCCTQVNWYSSAFSLQENNFSFTTEWKSFRVCWGQSATLQLTLCCGVKICNHDLFCMFLTLTSNLTHLENSWIWPPLIFKNNIIYSQLILFFSLPKMMTLVLMLQVKGKTLVDGQIFPIFLGKVALKNTDCKIFQKCLDLKTLCKYKLLLLLLLYKFKQH